MPEVIFIASELTLIECTVVLSNFEKLIRDERQLVALVIKFIVSGIFFVSMPSMDFKRRGF